MRLINLTCAVGIFLCFLPLFLSKKLYCSSCKGDDFPLAATLKNNVLEKFLILGVGICIPVFVDLVHDTWIFTRHKKSVRLLMKWNMWFGIALPFIVTVIAVIPFSYYELVPCTFTSSIILICHSIGVSVITANDGKRIFSRVMAVCFMCLVIMKATHAWTAFVYSPALKTSYLVFTILTWVLFTGGTAYWVRYVMIIESVNMTLEDYLCSIQLCYGILFFHRECHHKVWS